MTGVNIRQVVLVIVPRIKSVVPELGTLAVPNVVLPGWPIT